MKAEPKGRISPRLGRLRAVDELVVDRLITTAFGENVESDIKEALCLEMAGIADELAGRSPSLTERQLAESAALDWMTARLFQRVCMIAAETCGAAQQASVQTLIDRAHRRYLATIRTLATVRKLARRSSVVAVALTAEGLKEARCSGIRDSLDEPIPRGITTEVIHETTKPQRNDVPPVRRIGYHDERTGSRAD